VPTAGAGRRQTADWIGFDTGSQPWPYLLRQLNGLNGALQHLDDAVELRAAGPGGDSTRPVTVVGCAVLDGAWEVI
jgi:hypothetical protein